MLVVLTAMPFVGCGNRAIDSSEPSDCQEVIGNNTLFEVRQDSTVKWTPDRITFERIPARCGVANPPFDDLDLYQLLVYDAQGPEGSSQTGVDITFVRTDLVNKDYSISLSPLGANVYEQAGITAVNTTQCLMRSMRAATAAKIVAHRWK
jgi:hypothetical protein